MKKQLLMGSSLKQLVNKFTRLEVDFVEDKLVHMVGVHHTVASCC